jgi:DNA polymerase III sliding clamp (beta) subunit (PCNA family)
VLKGWIKIEIQGLSTRIMSSGDQMTIPSESFHKITAFKSEPTCYMFLFDNSHRMINNDYEKKFLSKRPQSDLMDFNSIIGKNNFTKNEHNLKETDKEIANVWLVRYRK